MHILHLTPYYPPAYAFGGVVRAVEGMAQALNARGHQVTVLTTDALTQTARHRGPGDEVIDGLRVLRRPNVSTRLRGRLNLSTPRSMRKTAQALLPAVDVLHIHEFRTLENLLVTPSAHALGIPIVLSPHGTLSAATGRSRLKTGWDRLLGAGVALRIDQVIALSESELQQSAALWRSFGKRAAPTQFTVIPNGIRLSDFADLPPAAEFRRRHRLADAPTVLFMGRLQERKGADILLRAFQQAAVEHSRLLIVGPDEGMRARLQRLAAGDPRIVITGYLGGSERLQAFAASDVFALPAVGEGLPMAALEALAAGLPVILSPGCNLPAGGAGYVVAAEVDAFAEKLRRLFNDRALRRRMSAAAPQLIQQHYTWDAIAAQLEAAYAALQ